MTTHVIVGIDEAGRGPLAGPVVAAAVHLSQKTLPHEKGGWTIDGTDIRLFDSKQLSEEEREAAFTWIINHCPHGIAQRSNTDIDALGILECNNAAMQEAVAILAQTITPTYLLVDGRDKFWFDYVHSSVIRGDSLEPSIAAASILAKVTRDRLMIEVDQQFPAYGFAGHKGYAAPKHLEAIKIYGACEIHRMTYLKNILTDGISKVSTKSMVSKRKRSSIPSIPLIP